MSISLANKGDTSNQSALTHPDLSLGSFVSTFSTPARNTRIPSSSTATSSAALATPSPPNAALFTKKRLDEQGSYSTRFGLGDTSDDHEAVAGGDVLDTPGAGIGGGKKWSSEALDTPGRMKRTRSAGSKGGANLTLRDQEKVSCHVFLWIFYVFTYNILTPFHLPSDVHDRATSQQQHACGLCGSASSLFLLLFFWCLSTETTT